MVVVFATCLTLAAIRSAISAPANLDLGKLLKIDLWQLARYGLWSIGASVAMTAALASRRRFLWLFGALAFVVVSDVLLYSWEPLFQRGLWWLLGIARHDRMWLPASLIVMHSFAIARLFPRFGLHMRR
jgi:hypothetical protein